jgi:hypothetical protein
VLIWLDDERRKTLKYGRAGCEHPALLTSKTHERDNAAGHPLVLGLRRLRRRVQAGAAAAAGRARAGYVRRGYGRLDAVGQPEESQPQASVRWDAFRCDPRHECMKRQTRFENSKAR